MTSIMVTPTLKKEEIYIVIYIPIFEINNNNNHKLLHPSFNDY